MLTAGGCAARRARLWESLADKPDWIVLYEPANLAYLSGFYAPPFVFNSQGAGAILILGRDGSSVLLTDNLLRNAALRAFVEERVTPTWYESKAPAPARTKNLVEHLGLVIQAWSGSQFGYDSGTPMCVIDRLRSMTKETRSFIPLAGIERLRACKDPDEVALIARCIAAAEAGMAAAIGGIHAGMTELQTYTVVHNAAMEEAGEPVIVYGDFASGPRAEQGGGPPMERIIEKGDLFILDFSVVINGYRGDFANTWVIDGEPTEQQRTMEEACKAAMAAGEAMLRPGMACREVDSAVRDALWQRGFGKNTGHHSGHGIGLGHPEAPFFVPGSDEMLEAGNVVTLEPGLYVGGEGGMRFERNYLVTNSGFECLTHHHIGLEPPC